MMTNLGRKIFGHSIGIGAWVLATQAVPNWKFWSVETLWIIAAFVAVSQANRFLDAADVGCWPWEARLISSEKQTP